MFKLKTSVRILGVLTALVIALTQLAGCGGSAGKSGDDADVAGPDGSYAGENVENTGGGSDVKGPPSNASESFSAFAEAKGIVITAISDALASNPDTAFEALSFIGVAFLDMALLPVASFGLGQEAASITLGMFGAEDISYSENGNTYTVKYTGQDGSQQELVGEYDKQADALKCTAKSDGNDVLVAEYRKTSYGYVSQYYSMDEDGTFRYVITISGNNGVVGITQTDVEPSALTGSEDIDFPKNCETWYEIKDNVVSGATADGTAFSFTYTPSEE